MSAYIEFLVNLGCVHVYQNVYVFARECFVLVNVKVFLGVGFCVCSCMLQEYWDICM